MKRNIEVDMNTGIKIRRKVLLSVLALVLAVGLGLAISSTMTPLTVGGYDSSLAHAHMSAPARVTQSETTPEDETEPEDTIGPAIALGMLGVGFALGLFVIYQCRKGSSESPPE